MTQEQTREGNVVGRSRSVGTMQRLATIHSTKKGEAVYVSLGQWGGLPRRSGSSSVGVYGGLAVEGWGIWNGDAEGGVKALSSD